MALKFLNKKGWHTGSLRNIENVWKAEQKHDAEQKKLEELKKQIQEERERAEFRQLQEQAGLVPRQERLDFLYDSGLAVGKGSSSGFKELEAPPKPEADSSISKQSSVPGALFEDKPQSANDTWRKLHSDPLLLIKQREQEALARIKNNPVQMSMIRKSAEAIKKQKEEKHETKAHKKKHRKKSRHSKHSSEEELDAEEDTVKKEEGRRQKTHLQSDFQSKSKHEPSSVGQLDSGRHSSDYEENKRYRREREGGHHNKVMAAVRTDGDDGRHGNYKERNPHKHRKKSSSGEFDSEGEKQGKKRNRKDADERNKNHQDSDSHKSLRNYASEDSESEREEDRRERNHHKKGDHHLERIHDRNYSEVQYKSGRTLSRREDDRRERSPRRDSHSERRNHNTKSGSSYREENEKRRASRPHGDHDKEVQEKEGVRLSSSHHQQRPGISKLTAEEKAARAREMQLDAELHEEQRWKRLKKASEADAREAASNSGHSGRNFLDSAQKSVYGTEKGGSATIEENVRRKSYYLQGRLDEGNAFRR